MPPPDRYAPPAHDDAPAAPPGGTVSRSARATDGADGDRAAARARLRRRARRMALRATLLLVAVSLGAASIAAFLLRWASGSGTDARLIAVAPFTIQGDDGTPTARRGDSTRDGTAAVDGRRTGPSDEPRPAPSADALALREGMLDLLAARLTGEDGALVTDPRALLAQWRRAAESDTTAPTRVRARGIARTLGAGRLMLGEVRDAGRRRILVDATMIDVNDGRTVATARVGGSLDSLPALVDRLAVRLLAGAGDGGARVTAGTSLAVRATASAPALRDYLAARELARHARLRESVEAYERALARDSAFALAAVELASVAAWLDDSTRLQRGVRLAWRERARLSMQDRALLEAKTGPRWPAEPTRAELVASKERYARIAPQRAEAWAEAGDGLFHLGPAVGAADAHGRAASAFRRALALDPSLAPALEHLALLAARDGGEESGRRRALQIADDALALGAPASRLPLLRWRVATLRGDSGALDTLARAGGSLDWAVVRLIAMTSVEDGGAAAGAARLLDGRLAAGGEQDAMPGDRGRPEVPPVVAGSGPAAPAATRAPALSLVAPTPPASPATPAAASHDSTRRGLDAPTGPLAPVGISDLRLAHDVAMNRGLAADAERAISEIQRTDAPLARRIRAMDAMFGDGDSVIASQSVRQLTLRTDRPPASVADQAAHLRDVCVVALWRAERGDPRGDDRSTRAVLAWLHDPASPPPTPDSAAMANAERSQEARALAASRRRGRGARAIFRTPPSDSAALERLRRWRGARSTLARQEAQACAIVLDASAARTRRVDLRRPAERLDSLLRVSAPGTLADDVGRLILARLLVRIGDRRDALASLRRRPYLYGLPGYVATSLREEAALAERTRDRRGALTAWRRYATLRADADPPLRPDVARAWLEVRRLEAR